MNSPDDLAAFWKSIDRPDLVVIKADQLPNPVARAGEGGNRAAASRWLVESVQVRGELTEDFANLTVELLIAVKGPEAVWVPIRLDRQTPLGAREGALELGLRRVDSGEWQVKLEREGRIASKSNCGRRSALRPRESRSRWRYRKRPRRPRFHVFTRRDRHCRGSQRGRRPGGAEWRQADAFDRPSLAALEARIELDERRRHGRAQPAALDGEK